MCPSARRLASTLTDGLRAFAGIQESLFGALHEVLKKTATRFAADRSERLRREVTGLGCMCNVAGPGERSAKRERVYQVSAVRQKNICMSSIINPLKISSIPCVVSCVRVIRGPSPRAHL